MFVSSQEGSRREIPSTRVKEVDSDENTRHFWLAIARVEACCSNPAALTPVRTGPCSSAGLGRSATEDGPGYFRVGAYNLAFASILWSNVQLIKT